MILRRAPDPRPLMRSLQFLQTRRLASKIQQLQQRPSEIRRRPFIQHRIIRLANHVHGLCDMPASEHQMAGWIRHGGEWALVQIVVVDGIPAECADETVGVFEARGVSGGEQGGHDAAFGDYEVGEFGEEVRRVAVCGEDDVPRFDCAAGRVHDLPWFGRGAIGSIRA